jgi:hypothetical protein
VGDDAERAWQEGSTAALCVGEERLGCSLAPLRQLPNAFLGRDPRLERGDEVVHLGLRPVGRLRDDLVQVLLRENGREQGRGREA